MKKLFNKNPFVIAELSGNHKGSLSIAKKIIRKCKLIEVDAIKFKTIDNDKTVLGSNQENAAYPSGLCAERVAIFSAGALYPDAKITKIAISATSDHNPTLTPIPPCGACRQSISEYEIKQEQPIEIYFMGESGNVYKSDSLKNLLPLMFDKKLL